uniref:3'-5' exonuclease domain-containing protein n=1 Tax=Neospora caninum (strain Liverpool) TaxID=572307 RepID=A0A0F7U6U5_NEOCL|nr:TPA: hypothetical protein BN1204_007100 [Neospora caninum Liverpool]
MLPDCRGLVYPIHHGEPLPLLAVRLCREQKVQELAANIAQRLLDALKEAEEKRKGETWEEERRALRAANRRSEEGNLKALLDCTTFRKGEKRRKGGLEKGDAEQRHSRIRCYWPTIEDDASKMSVFFREFHATLYLLFEPRLFSSPPLSPFLAPSSSSLSPSSCSSSSSSSSSSFLSTSSSSPSSSSLSPSFSLPVSAVSSSLASVQASTGGDWDSVEGRAAQGEALAIDARSNGEFVFALLHPHVLEMVVPSLKQGKRLHLLLAFLHCVESYFALHPCSKETVDPNRLLFAVGPARALLLLSRLGFFLAEPSQCAALPQLLFAKLGPSSVDAILLELLKDPGGNVFEAIKFVSFLRALEKTKSLDAPLKGSRWTLRDVTDSVSSRRSEHLLLAFLRSLAPPETQGDSAERESGEKAVVGEEIIRKEEERERGETLATEACAWLARKTPDTGEIADSWGYLVSRAFLLSRLRRQQAAPAAPELASRAENESDSQEGRKGTCRESEEVEEDGGCEEGTKRLGGRPRGSEAAVETAVKPRGVRTLDGDYVPQLHASDTQEETAKGDETDSEEEELLSLPCVADSAGSPGCPSASFSPSWTLPPEASPQREEHPTDARNSPLLSPSSSPSSPSSSSPPSSPPLPPLSLPFGVDRVVFLDTVEGLTRLFAFLRASQEAACRVLTPAEAAGASLAPPRVRWRDSRGAPPAEGGPSARSSPSPSLSTGGDADRAQVGAAGRDAVLHANKDRKEAIEKKDKRGENEEEGMRGDAAGKHGQKAIRRPEACEAVSGCWAEGQSSLVLSREESVSATARETAVSLLPPLPSVVPFLPFVVALDLEWTLPHAASVLSLATESRVFLIDLVNQNPVYKATLLQLLRWVFANPFIAKLMYQASGDITKLFFALGAVGRPGVLTHCIDLRHPRVRLSPGSTDRVARRVHEAPAGFLPPAEVATAGRASALGWKAARTLPATNGGERETGRRQPEEGGCDATDAEGKDAGEQTGPGARRVRLGEDRSAAAQREEWEDAGGNEDETPGKRARPVKRRFPSLQEMCRQVLHADLDKAEQRSNWNMRPLTVSQTRYAALDAYVLILLEAALRRHGWVPENILGGLGEFSALAFRGRPADFQIHYQKNASMQASKVEAAERREFRWR